MVYSSNYRKADLYEVIHQFKKLTAIQTVIWIKEVKHCWRCSLVYVVDTCNLKHP